MEAQLGKPPILHITAKFLFTNSFFLLLHVRMVLDPIYQLLLEGGYDPLVYQPLLKGCCDTLFTSYHWKEATTPCFFSYNCQDVTTPYLPASAGRRIQPCAGMLPALAPPCHPNMFSIIFQISLPFNICHTY